MHYRSRAHSKHEDLMPDTELLQMALVGYEAERQNIQAKIAELPAPTEWPRRSRRWSGGHYSHEARQKAHEYRCEEEDRGGAEEAMGGV
jgi:hypothetical protein